MTVLAAFQGNGFAIIGADSRATDASGAHFILSNPKLTRDDDDHYLFAITGATRGGNIVQQGWDAPTPPVWSSVEELDKFMTRDFIPQMRNMFIDAGYEGITLDGEGVVHDTNFFVAVHGIIYPIFNDYSWDRDTRGIYANGSGGDVALGVMVGAEIEKYRNDVTKAKAIVKKAIEKACQWNAYCALPVVLEVQYANEY